MFAAAWSPVFGRGERRGLPRTAPRRRRSHRPGTTLGGPRRSCRPHKGSPGTSWSGRFDRHLPRPRPARPGRPPLPPTAAPAQAASAGSPSLGERTRLRRQNPDRIPLCLEDDGLDIAEVLAVDLKRERAVGANLDPVEIVAVEDILRMLATTSECVAKQARDPGRSDPLGRNQIEPELEPCLGSYAQWAAARKGIRIAVGDQRECGTAEAFDLERRLVMATSPGEQLDRLPGEGEVTRPTAVTPTAPLVDAADE